MGVDQFTVLLQAGTISSVVVSVLQTPLDVARHSQQAVLAPRKATPGLRETLRQAAQTNTVGIFRGIAPAVGRAALQPAVFLTTYQFAKQSRGDVLEAGLIARAVSTAVLHPLDFIRVQRQSGVLMASGSSVHLERNLWDLFVSDGLKSFWRGGIAAISRDVSCAGLFWTTYMVANKELMENGGGSPVQLAGVASLCGAAAAAVTHPLDVIKTRMQAHELVKSDKDGFRKVIIPRFFVTAGKVWKAGGVLAFFTGSLPRVFGAASAALFLGPLYEYGHLLAEDNQRPVRKEFYLPPDTSNTIVHPRSQRAMFIDIK